jgi:preprotein translocase subunit SecD
MKTKGKSAALFIACVLIIGLLAYLGAMGATIGDYQVKPLTKTITKGLDLQGGISVVEEIQSTETVKPEDLARTMELISLRVNKMGVSETTISKEGTKRIRIDIPGKFDSKEVIDTVGKSGKLRFVGPDNSEILTGSDVKNAVANLDQSNGAIINLDLNDAGTKKFTEATQKFLGQKIAIYMDEDKINDPTVQSVITGGSAQITGLKDLQEAKKQAGIIKSGALPLPIKTVEVKVVGPSLGANAMPQSILAGTVGIGIVFLFMILYYRIPGLIADIALLLYIIILLGAFSVIGVTLTLPGIAGFLLTVGMAVDANVLIIERMKEELKSGKTPKAAIEAGFHRALSSILDSNITTIISGVVLYALGSGSVRGFALTLIIGVLLSMFTAITVTRFLTRLAAKAGFFDKKWAIGTFGVHAIIRG